MTPRASRRALLAVGLVAAVGAGAVGCAPVTDPDWVPPAWPVVTEVRVAEPPAPLDVTGDTAVAASVTPVRLRSDAIGVQVRATFLPGATAFNDAVETRVRRAVDAAAAVAGVGYEPAPLPRGAGLGDRECEPGSTVAPAAEVLADPALGPSSGSGTAVVCDIVAAGGGFLGERIRVVTGSPDAVASDTAAVLYVDTATGETVTAADLWNADAARTLSARIVEVARR